MQKTNTNNHHLVRSLSPVNVWALAFGCVIGWSAYVMPGTVFLPSAGPMGTLIAMELAVIVMLIISYNYSYMIGKFPLTGGEFIYAKMAFGDTHGFICAWFLSLAYLSVIPLNATALNLIMRAVFGTAFQFGFNYTVSGYDVWFGEIALAFCAIFFFMFISFLGVKVIGRLQTFLVAILLGGILIVIGGAILSPHASSANLQPMFRPLDATFSKGVIAQIIAVFVTGPMSFVGFDTVPQLMEEADFSPDRVKVTMDTSIVCGGFVYIALTLFACSIYSGWPEHISALSGLSGISAFPTLNASITVLGVAGLVVIVCSVVAAMLTGIIGFYMATSRLLYSMARDGMIPLWFARLNKRGTPVNAGIFCAVMSGLICLIGRAVMGWIFDMASTGAAIGFAYTSLSAAKYALYERRLDILIFGSLGFLLSLIMAAFLLVPLPGLNVSLGKQSYILLVAWISLGIMFYVFKRRGGGGISNNAYFENENRAK